MTKLGTGATWDRVVEWFKSAMEAGVDPLTPRNWDGWDNKPCSSERVYQVVRREGRSWPEAVNQAAGTEIMAKRNKQRMWSESDAIDAVRRFLEATNRTSLGAYETWRKTSTLPDGRRPPTHLTVRAAIAVKSWPEVIAAAKR